MTRRAARPSTGESAQLDLLAPRLEGWWEFANGASTVWVQAEDSESAREKAEALLRDLGVIPGGPARLHESYLRMREFALRGRR
ncbi:MAG: hypothetical protein U0R71_03860 [Solirubrobacterales bacterium]